MSRYRLADSNQPTPLADVARAMGICRQRVKQLLRSALAKLRARPVRLERFRQAVLDQRAALDARISNRPWNDMDAERLSDSAGASYRRAWRARRKEAGQRVS
jgi:hypothetical protein